MSGARGPWVVAAKPGGAQVEPLAPLGEIANALAGGTIVVVQGAFDPASLRQARRAIVDWNAPDTGPDMADGAPSTRERRDDPPGSPIRHAFDSYLFAVDNPRDAIGRALRPTFERLAALWRAVSAGEHGFAPGADGRRLRARGLHYPVGGGYFDWHEHPAEPLRVGVILGASEAGCDFHEGATEFRTPSGVVSISAAHGIGDVCLFRYDLSHRVTAVDPGRPRRWDGAGRWVFTLTIQ